MTPRARTRTQTCSVDDARTRIAHTRRFLEVAELIADEGDAAYRSVATSLAALAGIAASDAICCSALGRRSRGQDHHDAIRLLEEVNPGGGDASKALGRLLSLKDKAQYGLAHIGDQGLRAAIRQARALSDLAEQAIQRT